MDVVAVIPARYGSTRFCGKPLANRTGKPLIQHVCERVRASARIGRCIVATDDERIVAAVRGFGGEAVMTRADHASGTDRIAEVVAGLDGSPDDVVVNVQGDEPEIEPAYLDQLVDRLAREPADACPMATLACPFPGGSDPRDPNRVKVVLDAGGRALYFSRSLIPYVREASEETSSGPWLLHLGIYAYRRGFLLRFAGMAPGRLERLERLEQLRALERGAAIAVEAVPHAAAGIDTPQDYDRFVARWQAGIRADETRAE